MYSKACTLCTFPHFTFEVSNIFLYYRSIPTCKHYLFTNRILFYIDSVRYSLRTFSHLFLKLSWRNFDKNWQLFWRFQYLVEPLFYLICIWTIFRFYLYFMWVLNDDRPSLWGSGWDRYIYWDFFFTYMIYSKLNQNPDWYIAIILHQTMCKLFSHVEGGKILTYDL